MSFYNIQQGKKRQNKGKIPGTIILIFGIAFVLWFCLDSVLVSQGARVVYLTDMLSVLRLVLGVIFIFGGMWVRKWEEMATIRP